MLFDSTSTFLDPNRLCVTSRLPVLALSRLCVLAGLSLLSILVISTHVLGGVRFTYLRYNSKRSYIGDKVNSHVCSVVA